MSIYVSSLFCLTFDTHRLVFYFISSMSMAYCLILSDTLSICGSLWKWRQMTMNKNRSLLECWFLYIFYISIKLRVLFCLCLTFATHRLVFYSVSSISVWCCLILFDKLSVCGLHMDTVLISVVKNASQTIIDWSIICHWHFVFKQN